MILHALTSRDDFPGLLSYPMHQLKRLIKPHVETLEETEQAGLKANGGQPDRMGRRFEVGKDNIE